jgi:hypothetical protein
MELALFGLILFALLGLNAKATLLIARDSLSSSPQKFWQLVLVWLVPIFGAVVTLAVHRPIEEPSRQYRKPLDAGDDFAMSGRAHKNIVEAIDGD